MKDEEGGGRRRKEEEGGRKAALYVYACLLNHIMLKFRQWLAEQCQAQIQLCKLDKLKVILNFNLTVRVVVGLVVVVVIGEV